MLLELVFCLSPHLVREEMFNRNVQCLGEMKKRVELAIVEIKLFV